MLNIVKSFFDRFPFFRRTQQVRDGTVNAPNVGSNPTAEATSPWKPDHPDNWPWPPKHKKTVQFEKTNTIVLTSGKTKMELTEKQALAMRIDDLRDTLKINAIKSSIYRANTHKPQKNVKKRCRKLMDAANECFETKVIMVHGKAKTVKTEKLKEGKLDEYKKHIADAKALAKTLRSRQTRPFNSTLHYTRTHTLRKEQRASYIAYGFVKGKRYTEIEDNPRWKRSPDGVKPDWVKVTSILIETYGVNTKQGNIFEIRKELSDKLDLWKGN